MPGDEDPDLLIEHLARPRPGEPIWETLARKRKLKALLEHQIREQTKPAIVASREAGVRAAELAQLWEVTVTWIYTQVRSNTRRK